MPHILFSKSAQGLYETSTVFGRCMVLRHRAAFVAKDWITRKHHSFSLHLLVDWSSLILPEISFRAPALYNKGFLQLNRSPPRPRKMSDDAYSSFLDQANQATGASKSSTQSVSKDISTRAVDTDIPAVIQNVKVDYTSETDEPFEPVSLSYSGKYMPSESWYYPETLDTVSRLLVLDADTSQENSENWLATMAMSPQWSPRNLIRMGSTKKCCRQLNAQEMVK